MIEKSIYFKELLRQLQQVPYLATKNIYHIVDFFLSLEQEKVNALCKALYNAKAYIIHCQKCFAWKEKEQQCFYCDMPQRDQTLICVVETWHELMAIEKTAGYQGVYHVLGGVLSPLEGVGPDRLTIKNLVARVDETTQEVILATNQTPEGEATASYIARALREKSVRITCLARGVPVGSSLKFMDKVTVYKALTDRRPF